MEPKILINGHILSEAEAMAIRVAIQTFAISLEQDELGIDQHARIMSVAYLSNIDRINDFMQDGVQND